MSLSRFVGLRYLRAKKDSRFLSLITGFSVAGVALGVCTLIVILSVMDGFEGALKGRLSQGDFHVLVTRDAAGRDPFFAFPTEQTAKVYAQSDEIEAVNPVLSTEAILRAKKRVSGMTLRGVSDAQMAGLAKHLVEAIEGPRAMSPEGLWVGRELAYQLNILPGDKVQVISPTETEGPLESVPRLRSFRVEGIYESGIPEKDLHVVYAPIESVRAFVQKPGLVNQVEISVKRFEESRTAAGAVRELLGAEFTVKDWEQLNAHLFASLRLERITMFVILTMIILVASFNIVTSLKMLVIEKRREIAILQAMGATSRQIARIFLFQGVVIANVGSLLGGVAGVGIALALKRYQFIELPDIFYDRSLPVLISPLFVVGVMITAVLIVLGASFFPARSAMRVRPIEGIRDL